MKTNNLNFKIFGGFMFFTFLFSWQNAEAQFLKKLKKRAERAAEEAVIRKTEEKVDRETSKTMDTIYGNGKKPTKKTNQSTKQKPTTQQKETSTSIESNEASTDAEEIKINTKFDFVPGNKVLFHDDFSNDFVGDFPAKWNTSGGGELVEIDKEKGKWLKILPGHNSIYIPDLKNIPEDFTIEFDVITKGLSNKTSSAAKLQVAIADNNTFSRAKNLGFIEYSFCQYIDIGITVDNKVNGKRALRNTIKADIRDVITKKHHISIAVNKQRVRMWINQSKYVDVPRLLPESVKMQSVKLGLSGTDINKENIYISDFKFAEGGLDLRRELINKGKFSTNGILFASGSDKIQPQSYGIIRQISQAMQQEKSMRINIVGHTDSDGADETNLTLSKKRAKAVKNALITGYNIDASRIETDGKGASKPVADNNTADGKRQNRRVEFIKL